MLLANLLPRRGPLGEAGRRLEAVGRTPICEAPDEAEAKLVGRLRHDGEPLTAPLSGRRCACWEVFVEERPVGEAIWFPLVRRHEFQACWLDDGTGSAWISPRAWGFEVVRGQRQRSWLLRPPPEELLDFLRENRLPTTGLGDQRQLRWEERVIAEGELVAVLGPCRWAPDPRADGGYREAPKRLEVGGEQSGVIVSNDPRIME